MTTRAIGWALACCLVAAAMDGRLGAHARREPAQHVALDAVLATYLSGDTDVIRRTFARSGDFQDRLRLTQPRELDRWLGSWDRGKALFVLEVARAASLVAPRYSAVLIGAGRRYFGTAPAGDLAAGEAAAFAELWHRTAVGLLQAYSDPWRVEEHVADLVGRAGAQSGPLDGRLVLARGVAKERACWGQRPSLDQPASHVEALVKAAGVTVSDDLDGPAKSGRETRVNAHLTCLRDALAQFEAAAVIDDSRAEARMRGGWTLFQLGRLPEALVWLDIVEPGDDRDMAYWLGLLRGRVLDGLARFQAAASAYEDALAICPGAQSAGVGLALALVRLDRVAEADEVARALRAAGATAPDPWSTYLDGDQRFVDRWLTQLRTGLR
jgi:tetratricopeptide (TPR) repeat protein